MAKTRISLHRYVYIKCNDMYFIPLLFKIAK